MPRAETVCLLGHHEPDYPRNRSIRAALSQAGYCVLEVHSRAPFPWRHLILGFGYLKLHRQVRWVFITEGGHRLVPLIKALARLTGRQVVFDPFLSRYNTRIEDRRLHRPGGLQALICLWQDWSSTHAADALVFDTAEHRDYFFAKYLLRKPYRILPVGVDEGVFAPAEPSRFPRPYRGDAFQVLFYGSYIPLQGIEHILAAAASLKGKGFRFTLIGKGQTYRTMRDRARALELEEVEFVPPLPEAGLLPYLAHADACLGIFSDNAKAGNVVPNKVVQAAAMGKAMVTRDSPAVRGYFRTMESAFLVPPASPEALAGALLDLRADPALRKALGAGARAVFEANFSVRVLGEALRGLLEGAG